MQVLKIEMKTIILNILRCCTHLKGGNVCLFNNFEMILENILQILFLPKISHNASQSPNLNPSMLYLQMTDKKTLQLLSPDAAGLHFIHASLAGLVEPPDANLTD